MSHQITWCHHRDSHTVLGRTFDACVLQDFESLTPNIIARCIETVKGGGLIIFLLPNVKDLASFGTISMDVHKHYRTAAYDTVEPRFNFRMYMSLASAGDCLVMDDELTLQPINEALWSQLIAVSDDNNSEGKGIDLDKFKHKELKKLSGCASAPLLELCATKDQTRSLRQLVELLRQQKTGEPMQKRKKTERRRIAMVTSGRGRGKSALLGLAIAAAVVEAGERELRVCVAAPGWENVMTLMQFVAIGLDRAGFAHGGVEPGLGLRCGDSRVRFVAGTNDNDADTGGCDVLAIDETAALPLPCVRRLLERPHDVLMMSSTLHGYEGTGRSLSLKLMKDLRNKAGQDELCEITLTTPIRYSTGDHAEQWLNDVFCLDCEQYLSTQQPDNQEPPTLGDCQLYRVNRDQLFSAHPLSEKLLHQLMAVYVASHYKNTPNDLQMLADSASHALFCLCARNPTPGDLPHVCAVIQLAFEGGIDQATARASIDRGLRPAGDMVPWTVLQQFNDTEFVNKRGARVVRIAVHPDMQRRGYGGHALKLLQEYYSLPPATTDCALKNQTSLVHLTKEQYPLATLTTNQVDLSPLGPLLTNGADQRESLSYLSVSYGLTHDLFRFWKKAKFVPVYLRQTKNESTGEFSCVMLRHIDLHTNANGSNLEQKTFLKFHYDFSRRLSSLLAGPFRDIDSMLALDLLHQRYPDDSADPRPSLSSTDVTAFLSSTDIDRLDRYIRGAIDYHAVLDLMSVLASLMHCRKVSTKPRIPKIQTLILVGLGLQHKTVDDLVSDLARLHAEPAPGSKSDKIGVRPVLRSWDICGSVSGLFSRRFAQSPTNRATDR